MHKYICENIIDLETNAEDFFGNSWFIETKISNLDSDKIDSDVYDYREHGEAHFHLIPIFKSQKGKIKQIKKIKQNNKNKDDDTIKIFITFEIPQTADDIRYNKDSPYKLNNELKELIVIWAKKDYEEQEIREDNNKKNNVKNTYTCIIPIEKGKIKTNWDYAKELWVNSILNSPNYNIPLMKEIRHKIDIYHEIHGSNAIYPIQKSDLPRLFKPINYYQ